MFTQYMQTDRGSCVDYRLIVDPFRQLVCRRSSLAPLMAHFRLFNFRLVAQLYTVYFVIEGPCQKIIANPLTKLGYGNKRKL